jgi:hypothetical protein
LVTATTMKGWLASPPPETVLAVRCELMHAEAVALVAVPDVSTSLGCPHTSSCRPVQTASESSPAIGLGSGGNSTHLPEMGL